MNPGRSFLILFFLMLIGVQSSFAVLSSGFQESQTEWQEEVPEEETESISEFSLPNSVAWAMDCEGSGARHLLFDFSARVLSRPSEVVTPPPNPY